jgi:vacuolar-type H+-ATPase subunit C/Vma6
VNYYRLVTALPPLPDGFGPLSVPLPEVVALILDEVDGDHAELVHALLWFIDTQNAEALLLKKSFFDPRGTCTQEQLETRQSLPAFLDEILRSEESMQPAQQVARLWNAYFAQLTAVAEKHRNRFLSEFVELETGLRNAIAHLRAEQMSVDPDLAMVQGGEGASLYQALVLRAAEAPDPESRERLLDRERVALYQELEGIDPFSIDAILSYLSAALVLDAWRVTEATDPETMLEVFA